jgi:hypothetical protein
MFDLSHWTQPRRGIYHYVPFDAMDLGPDRMWTPVRCALKPPYYSMVGKYTRRLGEPKVRPTVLYRRLELNYLREHAEFRRVLDIEKAMTDKQIALVMDYSHLHLGWKYVVNQWTAGTCSLTCSVPCSITSRACVRSLTVSITSLSRCRTRYQRARTSRLRLRMPTVAPRPCSSCSAERPMSCAWCSTATLRKRHRSLRSYEEVYSFAAPWMFMDDDGVLSYEAEVGTESFDESLCHWQTAARSTSRSQRLST